MYLLAHKFESESIIEDTQVSPMETEFEQQEPDQNDEMASDMDSQERDEPVELGTKLEEKQESFESIRESEILSELVSEHSENLDQYDLLERYQILCLKK